MVLFSAARSERDKGERGGGEQSKKPPKPFCLLLPRLVPLLAARTWLRAGLSVPGELRAWCPPHLPSPSPGTGRREQCGGVPLGLGSGMGFWCWTSCFWGLDGPWGLQPAGERVWKREEVSKLSVCEKRRSPVWFGSLCFGSSAPSPVLGTIWESLVLDAHFHAHQITSGCEAKSRGDFCRGG